jgi:hypothetical protein
LAILTGDDEIPVSRLDFWHGYGHLALLEHRIHHFRRGERTEARHGAKRTPRRRRRYRSGRSKQWVKVKNPAAPALRREAEEDWRRVLYRQAIRLEDTEAVVRLSAAGAGACPPWRCC